jgi:hypothetical protein
VCVFLENLNFLYAFICRVIFKLTNKFLPSHKSSLIGGPKQVLTQVKSTNFDCVFVHLKILHAFRVISILEYVIESSEKKGVCVRLNPRILSTRNLVTKRIHE